MTKVIHSVEPVIIEIKPSKLVRGEVGLFAACPIKKKSIIAFSERFGDDYFISWKDFRKLDKITKNKMVDYCVETPNGLYTRKEFNYMSLPWHMNHNCNNNVGCDNHNNFIAVRNIKKGEELTLDYGLFMSYPKYRLECKCGSKNCRKVITGNDWMNPDLIKQKGKYMMSELKKTLKKKK